MSEEKKIQKELILRDLYYSPKVGYRSPDHLYELAKEEDPDISKYFVKQWLLKQSAYTKFKKWNNPKHYRHTMVRDFNQLQMDLVFMIRHKDENNGYAYILVAIEILSRFAFVVPLKNKNASTTREGIKIVLKKFEERFDMHRDKIYLQFDEGEEFINNENKKFFEKENINYFFTRSPRKATIVERLNRTLKTKMLRMFEREGNHHWVEHLQDLVDNYNDTIHSSIKMKPKDVNNNNKFTVWGRLFGHLVTIKKPKFQEDDQVRILHFDIQHRASQFSSAFGKKHPIVKKEGKKRAYVPHAVSAKGKPPFSEEIFKIWEVKLGDPIVYKLYSDEIKDEIMGIFYEEELSLVKEEDSFESHKDSEE